MQSIIFLNPLLDLYVCVCGSFHDSDVSVIFLLSTWKATRGYMASFQAQNGTQSTSGTFQSARGSYALVIDLRVSAFFSI